jgi:AcrR family transcriptional regulator
MGIQNNLLQRKQTEREERVDRILEAARKMFLEKGYVKTTIRSISTASELSTGAIYSYFKNKEDIYVRILEEAFLILGEMLRDAEEGERDGMKKMRAVIMAYYKFYLEYNEHYRLLDTVTYWRGMLSAEKNKHFIGVARSHLAVVDVGIRKLLEEKGINGQDSWKLAYDIWAGAEGLFSIDKMGYLAGESYALRELLDEQLTIFEQGLLSR